MKILFIALFLGICLNSNATSFEISVDEYDIWGSLIARGRTDSITYNYDSKQPDSELLLGVVKGRGSYKIKIKSGFILAIKDGVEVSRVDMSLLESIDHGLCGTPAMNSDEFEGLQLCVYSSEESAS